MKEKKPVTNFTLFADSSDHSSNWVDRVFGALWLISLGIVFFLNTTGVLPWNIWGGVFLAMVKLWPVFLIGVGVNIIAGNSVPAKFITSVLWYLMFAVIFVYAASNSANYQNFWEDFPDAIVNEATNSD